jgi:hypothetical protein
MESASASQWTVCERCKSAREAGSLADAIDCTHCGGKGIARTRESFVCNQCGECLCPDVDNGNRNSPDGLVEARVRGNYDSTGLLDTTVYEFSICEKCLRKLFNGFAIPPKVGEYMLTGRGDEIMNDEPDAYATDRERYETSEWRRAGGEKQKFGDGLCNRTRLCPNKAEWRMLLHSSISWDVCCEEHRPKEFVGHSYLYVPIGLLADVGGEESITDEQRKRIVRIVFALTKKNAPVTVYRYVTHDVAMLLRNEALYHDPDHHNPWMAWVVGGVDDEMHRKALHAVDPSKMLAIFGFTLVDTAMDAALGCDTRGTLLVAPDAAVLQPLLAHPPPLGVIEL